MVTDTCTDCPRNATRGRSLCWHCTNLKKRYGVTAKGIDAYLRAIGTVCYVCVHTRRGLRMTYGRPICRLCRHAVKVMAVPGTIELVSNLINANSVNDNRVETQSVTSIVDNNLPPQSPIVEI